MCFFESITSSPCNYPKPKAPVCSTDGNGGRGQVVLNIVPPKNSFCEPKQNKTKVPDSEKCLDLCGTSKDPNRRACFVIDNEGNITTPGTGKPIEVLVKSVTGPKEIPQHPVPKKEPSDMTHYLRILNKTPLLLPPKITKKLCSMSCEDRCAFEFVDSNGKVYCVPEGARPTEESLKKLCLENQHAHTKLPQADVDPCEMFDITKPGGEKGDSSDGSAGQINPLPKCSDIVGSPAYGGSTSPGVMPGYARPGFGGNLGNGSILPCATAY